MDETIEEKPTISKQRTNRGQRGITPRVPGPRNPFPGILVDLPDHLPLTIIICYKKARTSERDRGREEDPTLTMRILQETTNIMN